MYYDFIDRYVLDVELFMPNNCWNTAFLKNKQNYLLQSKLGVTTSVNIVVYMVQE